jgi:putative transposase
VLPPAWRLLHAGAARLVVSRPHPLTRGRGPGRRSIRDCWSNLSPNVLQELSLKPLRAPQANAIAERFARTVRGECLDWLLILNRRHLERVLRAFIDHDNTQRPHRALALQPPQPQQAPAPTIGEVRRHDRLGGLIHEHYRAAA